jgi:hypothetical protein
MWGSAEAGKISLATHGTPVGKTGKTLLERATPVVPEDFQNHLAPLWLGIPLLTACILDGSACWREEAASICWFHKKWA